MGEKGIIDIVKVSTPGREGYYRITLKKSVVRRLNVRAGDIIAFYRRPGGGVRIEVIKLSSQKSEE